MTVEFESHTVRQTLALEKIADILERLEILVNGLPWFKKVVIRAKSTSTTRNQ